MTVDQETVTTKLRKAEDLCLALQEKSPGETIATVLKLINEARSKLASVQCEITTQAEAL